MNKNNLSFDNISNLKLLRCFENSICVYTGYYNDNDNNDNNVNDNNAILVVKNKNLPICKISEFRNLELILDNDRFHKYDSDTNSKCEILVIYPAIKEDFKKYIYTSKKKSIETYEMYYNNIYPKIITQDLTWINNIVNGISENESIIYNDNDFILMPDLKWDNKTIDDLYYLVIFKDKQLKSIRDLNLLHVTLLQKTKDISIKKIKELHNIDSDQLRLYFHYYPSFWQLHLHVNLITKNWNGSCIDVAHPLSTVINNIKLVNNYYQIMDIEITH